MSKEIMTFSVLDFTNEIRELSDEDLIKLENKLINNMVNDPNLGSKFCLIEEEKKRRKDSSQDVD